MKILYITDLSSVPCEIAVNHDLTVLFGEGYHEYADNGLLIKDDRSKVLIRSKFLRENMEPPKIIRVEELKEMTVDVIFEDLTETSTMRRLGDLSKVKSKFGVFRVVHDEYTKQKLIDFFGEKYAEKLVMINNILELINKLSGEGTD
jgi:hypothetical protein